MEIDDAPLIDKLAALSHPQRLAVFRLLVRRCPDALPAGEIAQVLGLKPSTLSVYLSVLTRARLISQTRQGTSLRYALDTGAAQELMRDLFLDCCRGRPDLCPPVAHERPGPRKHSVLFLCTGNSARSILAEAILRDLAGDRFEVVSAGTRPAEAPHPRALALLADKGLATKGLRAKPVGEVQGPEAPRFDFVFTVCDHAANEECPTWQGQPIAAHWGLPDPTRATGTEAERGLAFQQTYAMLRHRIGAFAALPLDALDRVSVQTSVDDIGRMKETT
ncbi:helix-turn-helix domain-containing protein [Marinovum sp.]|uniref:arsenate reductase/protein-tyrosine-phosphatase family protein n=1 Tax=Marinovum sp. TaxID=2024839 RepID=UPI002B270684|nr:helix-turn-helix domain-containing protein [Marinovum sp.]